MSAHGMLYDKFWGKMDEWTRSRPLTPQEQKTGRQQRDKQEDSLLSLSNAEANFNTLRTDPAKIIISPEEALRIYFFFTGETLTADKMTLDARAFLQGALMAAVDGSYALGFVKIIFDSAYMKIPPSTLDGVRKLVVKVTVKMLKYMYKHMKEDNPSDAPLYKTVVAMIAYQCGHYFRTIKFGMEM